MRVDSSENQIGTLIVEAAIEVHRVLGNGLLESIYEKALAIELRERGVVVQRQVAIDVSYKGQPLGLGFRADLVVSDLVLIELKSVERITAAHRKQIQSYLSLMDLKLGYLLNFGAPLMRKGITRCVNNLPE